MENKTFESKENISVSVIMNCYNSSKWLKEAIDSVYAQTYKDWEIIFWDNASNDESPAIAKSYDNKLKYYRSEMKTTLGSARNFAIEKAKGEFIAFLDCDDLWLPDKLEKQMQMFIIYKEIDFIYSNFFINDYILNRKRIAYRGPQPKGYIFKEMLGYYSIGMLSVILRKSALIKLGELFEDKLSYAEEYDLFMRLLYKSKAGYINEPLAVYRIHGKMSTINGLDAQFNEMTYCVNKLSMLEINFKEKYKKEIEKTHLRLSSYAAGWYMLNHKPGIANKYLAKYKFKSLKTMFYYCITKLPYCLWLILWRFSEYFKAKLMRADKLYQN